MKRIVSFILLSVLCSLMLASCVVPDEPAENTSTPQKGTLEYGYDLAPDASKGCLEYMMALKIDECIKLNPDDNTQKISFSFSHGTVGPWVDGGCLYPDIAAIEIAVCLPDYYYSGEGEYVNDVILYRNKYFEYIEECFFVYKEYGKKHVKDAVESDIMIDGKPLKLYTSDYYDSEKKVSWIYFSNEEEYSVNKRSFNYGNDRMIFELREIYGDGTVKVAKTATLYYSKTESTIKFSTEPFDEAE